MLADLRRISCTSDSPSPDILSQMLQSAKSNLAKLPFFGLRDQFEASQYLFTWTFGLHFHQGITQQLNESLYFNWDSISDTDLASVKTQNAHDLQLYKFGQKLFSERLIYATNEDKKHGKTLFLPTLSWPSPVPICSWTGEDERRKQLFWIPCCWFLLSGHCHAWCSSCDQGEKMKTRILVWREPPPPKWG